MGPGAGAARGAARHRARPEHAAAGAPPRPDRPLRRARAATSRPMPRPSRRSARPRSSSARRWRPGPTWSGSRRRATSSCSRTACRPRRSRQIRRAIEQGLEKPLDEIFSDIDPGAGRRRLDRPGPPRRSPPTAGWSRSRCCGPISRRISPARSRPTNGRRRRSRRWAARRRGCGRARSSPISGNGPRASSTFAARPPRPPSCARISSPRAASSSPRSTGPGPRGGC